jgi:probable FeS assembly SUF system protein SufT
VRSHENEAIVIYREVNAVVVPAGQEVTLKPGQAGYITQALGGSFTLYIDGNLYRLAGADADAIGKQVLKVPELPPNATDSDVLDAVWAQLRTCFDPEIPINIVELGLVYDCVVTPNGDGTRSVDIKMTLTAPGCGMGPVIASEARSKVLGVPGVGDAEVELVWDPPWNQNMISEAGKMKLGLI